jgi:hypothetical protein
MLTTLLFAAAQAAAPVPPAAQPGERTVVREIVVHRDDKPIAAKGRDERREIVIIRNGDRTAAGSGPEPRVRIVDIEPGKQDERREIRILREPGAAGTKIAMLSCDNGAKVDSEATGQDGKKTRVMICAQGGNQIEALERASKRVADIKDIPEDVRTKVLSQMNAEIARLKTAK